MILAALAKELHNAVLNSSPVGWQQHQKQALQGATGGVVLQQVVQGCPVACFVTHMGSDMKVRPGRSLLEMPGYSLS